MSVISGAARAREKFHATVNAAPAEAASASGELPEIVMSTDLAGVVDAAEAAMLKRGGVFTRARNLVHVVRDRAESKGLAYPEGQPVIARIGRDRFREMLNGSATWITVRTTPKTKEKVYSAGIVPPIVSSTLLDRGEWSFPQLDGISDTPIFRFDGSVLDRPGYDPATRMIYDPCGIEYPPVPARPSQADAVSALKELLEPFSDFAFVADSDRSAAAGLVLTLIARAAIDGNVPMFIVRAPVPGAGKGLCVDVAALIATGRVAPKRAPVVNDDELRKAMLAYAIESPALVAIDNVEGTLGSPVLAMILTAGVITDRLLGANENRTASIRFVLVATGNNVSLRGDTGRRVVPIDLDPRCEHPEDRTGWRHPDLFGYVRAERPRLVTAALTILRGFVAAGRPGHGLPPKGSYEAWEQLVRGALIWAGAPDPLGGVQRVRAEGDEDLDRVRALHNTWVDSFGTAPTTIASAIKHAGDRGELHDALAAFCKTDRLESRPLGYAFKKIRGRIVDGREMLSEDGHAGIARWCIRSTTSGSPEAPQ